MRINIDQNETHCLVHLEGEVGIDCAAELKNVLLQALGSGKPMQVVLDRATDLDVTAMQLLWAVAHKAAASGTGCTVAGQIPKGIEKAVVDAGFEKFPVAFDQE